MRKKILILAGAIISGFLWSAASTWSDSQPLPPTTSMQNARIAHVPGHTIKPLRGGLDVAQFEIGEATNPLLRLTDFKKSGRTMTINDIAGEYVHTYSTLTNQLYDGGCSLTITPIAGTDSVKLTNFWSTGIEIKAKVDIASGKIIIPNQIAFNHATYGPMDIAVITQQATPDRTKSIEGVINSDGSISITSWWGIFIATEGENKDSYVAAAYNTVLERPNAVMTQKHVSGTESLYGVILSQPYGNSLTVKNFANYGYTITIALTGGEDGYIPQQTGRRDGAGIWKTICVYSYSDGNLNYGNIININGLEKRKVSWGPWSLLASDGEKTYFLGHMTEGYIVPTFDITLPPASSTGLEGEGTAENPWKVKTLADLNYIANQVNYSTDYNGIYVTDLYTLKYARVFIGKHFRLENDIDMGGWNFTPIGCDYSHRFAGTFDGNGHTLRNMQVSASAQMAAGFMGYADTVSTIRNLYIENPDVRGCDYYAAPVAGLSLGLIENCHVKNAKVYNSNVGAAGFVGYGKDVKNCTLRGAQTTALYGFTAGFATQIMGEISNCSATGFVAVGSSSSPGDVRYDMSGQCMGGLVASLFGTAKDCYVQGVVDAATMGVSQYAGGIAGTVTTGTIERCVAVVDVYGVGAGSVSGGIVGWCSGMVSDCYSAGSVNCVSSAYTGGITGRLSRYQNTGGPLYEATIKNSYTHALVNADSYKYDTSEMRETIGRVWTGASPTLSNLYFDNQVVNYRSDRFGVPTATLTSGTPLEGLSTDTWSYASGRYPMLKTSETSETALMGASAILMTGKTTFTNFNVDTKLTALGASKYFFLNKGTLSSTGHYASIVNDSIILNKNYEFGNDTLCLVNGEAMLRWVLKISPKFLEGEGTQENPFLIQNKEDLITLSEATTVAKQYFPNTYFLMTADIDLEYDPAFKGICGDGSISAMKFAGVLDGGGHTIHRMDRDLVEWTTRPEDTSNGIGTAKSSVGTYSGLCSRLDVTGVIRNLTLASDCRITGFSRSAAFVGDCSGLIENCVNHADVMSISMGAGGITGYLNKGGSIVNCLNTGNVRCGAQSVGGMAGYAYGTIENCVNTGDVSAMVLSTLNGYNSTTIKYCGGLGGNCLGVVMRNCVNYGTVYAYNGAAGGLAGRFPASSAGDGSNDAINCFNFGMVYTPDPATIGAIGGEKGTTGKTANSYWDAQMLPLKAAGNDALAGALPLNTQTVTSGTALEGYSTELWDFSSGKYPVLKQFAEDAKVSAARTMYFTLPEGSSVWSMSGSIVLPSGVAWTLSDGSKFKIENGSLVIPQTENDAILDTLIATVGGLRKPILIKAVPQLPLTGEGTAASPYLITTVTDWNRLADYISQSGDDVTGKYFNVKNDLDFTGVAMKRMGADGATAFGGIMDFEGHKLIYKDASAVAYSGAFGTVTADGGVKNLVLDATVESVNTYAAGLAGYGNGRFENIRFIGNLKCSKAYSATLVAMAGDGAKFINCVNNGTITGLSNVGGLVCKAGTGCEFIDCGNEGTVGSTQTATSVSYIGGLVADAGPSTFIRCYNKAPISVTTAGVGGILANASGKANSQAYVFLKCWNEGALTAQTAIGGVVYTFATTAGNSKLEMDSCYNTAILTANGTTNAGPVAGVVAKYPAGANIRDCWNNGAISSTKSQICGGVLGTISVAPTAAYPTTITRCQNRASVDISGAQSAGGVIGLISHYTTVTKCSNTGSVSSTGIAGGFSATLSGGNTRIEDCWNSGNVTASGYRVGGLFGASTSTTNCYVVRCFNIGNVATTSTTQGTAVAAGSQIGGLAGAGYGCYEHCWNSGEVTGVSQVGGLIGQPSKGKTCLTSCLNAGRVIAPADTAGNLIGVNLSNGRIWSADNKVENCYYATGLDTLQLSTIGTGVAMSELCKVNLGSDWNLNDDYTLPIPKVHSNEDAALLGAVQVVLASDDHRGSVTKSIFVGAPEKVSWSISPVKSVADGNKIRFTSQYNGPAVLTATLGNYTKSYTLHLNVGSGTTSAKDCEVVNEMWFNDRGLLVRGEKTPGLYIVVRHYADGHKEAEKVIIKP